MPRNIAQASDQAREVQGQRAVSPLVGVDDVESLSALRLVRPVAVRSAPPAPDASQSTTPAAGGSPGLAAGAEASEDALVTAQAFRAYLGLPSNFVHSTKGKTSRGSGSGSAGGGAAAQKIVKAYRVSYVANSKEGNVVRQGAQTRLVLLMETYARHDSLFDSLVCVDDQWPNSDETASLQRDTVLLLPTGVPVLPSQVHTELCSLALGLLYASIMIREMPQLGFTPAFTHKRAYSIPEFANDGLIFAQDDQQEPGAGHPGEAADDARWFAFQCFVFVRSKGSVFFRHKRTLASGLWSHPVLLTKGKDPSFDTAWKAWRDSIQVACAFLVIPGPGHMGDSCLSACVKL